MQNTLSVLAGYLGKISLPGLGVIDIIEIGLISFFVYQFMAWIKFTRAYTLLKGILIVLGFILIAYIFKMNTILWIFRNLANVLVIGVIVTSLILSISLNCNFSAGAAACPGTAGTEKNCFHNYSL